MLSASAPIVLLQHGGLDDLSGKTGLAMLRYRSGPIVAVIDPAFAGAELRAITGIPRAVPVVADMAAAIDRIVVRSCERANIPLPQLAFEPGRAIVGPAGITLYEVGTVKPVQLDQGLVRTFVSVDGGMSDNIRTALYDSDYTVVLASRESAAEPMLCRVVGKHCESGDVVVRDAWLPADLAPGDLLAVAATGAYCRSMASQYNYLPRPAVIGVRDGRASVVLRRETEEDLLALDPGAI